MGGREIGSNRTGIYTYSPATIGYRLERYRSVSRTMSRPSRLCSHPRFPQRRQLPKAAIRLATKVIPG